MSLSDIYEPQAPALAFHYPDALSFFTEHLAPMIRRRNGGGRCWCPEWWRHPEAVARITASWHAWENLRLQPGTGMSTWWVYHFDTHYAVLADADRGPFQACDRRHLEKLRPLAHAIPPPEWETALRHHPGPSSTPEGSTDA